MHHIQMFFFSSVVIWYHHMGDHYHGGFLLLQGDQTECAGSRDAGQQTGAISRLPQ